EELLDRVARLASRIEPAVDPLEVGEASDAHRLAERPAREEVDEGGVGGAHSGDGVHAARDFLDVHAGIGQLSWHGFLPFNSLHPVIARVPGGARPSWPNCSRGSTRQPQT